MDNERLRELAWASYDDLVKKGKPFGEQAVVLRANSNWYDYRNCVIHRWIDALVPFAGEKTTEEWEVMVDELYEALPGDIVCGFEYPDEGYEDSWCAWAIACLCICTSMWGMYPPSEVGKVAKDVYAERAQSTSVAARSGQVYDQARF